MLLDTATLAGLALGTLLSEDLTSIGAGLLVRDGQVSPSAAVAACSAGVYLGDLGLWLAGRVLGRRALTLPWLADRIDAAALEELSGRLDARLGPVVLGSRFLPGSRLPMFVAAGIWGRRPLAFAAVVARRGAALDAAAGAADRPVRAGVHDAARWRARLRLPLGGDRRCAVCDPAPGGTRAHGACSFRHL